MIKAILFDFGQTLVDSADGFRKAEKDSQKLIFQDIGVEAWDDFLSVYRKFRKEFHASSKFSRKVLWEAVYTYYNRKQDEEILLRAEQDYWETVKLQTKPFPETQSVLEQLTSDYRLGLVTNTQGQQTSDQHRLNLFPELESFFESIVVAGEDGVQPKPASEPFHICLDNLGTLPSESIYVGDDWRNDVCGAKDAGLHPIWLQHRSVSRNWPTVNTSVPIITDLEQLSTWLISNSVF